MTGITDHVSGTLSDLDKIVVSTVPPGGNWRDLPEDFPSKRVQQIREGARSGGGSRSTYYGRLRWDRPSYTISTYITRPGNGCFIHPEADRLITIREAARLQTFPDTVRFKGTARKRCMQVGNAVPPLLAYHLGRCFEPGSVVDLFSGAGGLGLGLEMAGHEVTLSADFDTDACETLRGASRSSNLVVDADLSRDVELEDLVATALSRRDEIDLLVGGPPCQGFSTAGPCRVDDPRNRLLLAFLRFVERTRPKRVLMENVPALRWRGAAFLDEVRDRLTSLGYETDLAILHAEAYGVPQLRRRLVLQATLDGPILWPAPSYQLTMPAFPADQPGGAGASDLPSPTTVLDALGDLPLGVGACLDEIVPFQQQAKSPLQEWLRGTLAIKQLAQATSVLPGVGDAQPRLPDIK